MKVSNFLYSTILGIVSTFMVLPYANAAEPLKMELQANKVVQTSDGKIKYIPVNTADSNTTVQYKATYTNTLTTPINDITVTLPIPVDMVFTGTASPADAQATIDGKNFANMPLMHRINGNLVQIPFSEYKSLRWQIKHLPAGKSAAVSANTRLDVSSQ